MIWGTGSQTKLVKNMVCLQDWFACSVGAQVDIQVISSDYSKKSLHYWEKNRNTKTKRNFQWNTILASNCYSFQPHLLHCKNPVHDTQGHKHGCYWCNCYCPVWTLQRYHHVPNPHLSWTRAITSKGSAIWKCNCIHQTSLFRFEKDVILQSVHSIPICMSMW